MATETSHQSSKTPAFLTPDGRVPLALRDLLVEADGCLKMSFLTGGTACIQRAVETLITLEGVQGADRAEQLKRLGERHASLPPSFLTLLNTSATPGNDKLDVKRLTLAIAILKAIIHEVCVAGPERAERFAYIRNLLETVAASTESAGEHAEADSSTRVVPIAR